MNLPTAHCITLAETPERTERLVGHLSGDGVKFEIHEGVNAAEFGLTTINKYEVDHPGSGYVMTQKHVGLHLSHVLAWRHFSTLPQDSFLVLEDDALFLPGWQDGFDLAMESVPDDWDMLFIGSCNCEHTPKELVSGNVWRVDKRHGPQCTHAYIVRAKALPILLKTQKKSWAPIDLALIFNSFPHLNIYTVLPRIVRQHRQELCP